MRLQSDWWVGYAALTCAALLQLEQMLLCATEFGLLGEVLGVLIGVSLIGVGTYCGVRGVFVGPRISRICAGLSIFYWTLVAQWILRGGLSFPDR